MILYDVCEICCEEFESHKKRTCDICDTELCEDCYEENEGYCEECYDKLLKEKSEVEKELWKAFWASKF